MLARNSIFVRPTYRKIRFFSNDADDSKDNARPKDVVDRKLLDALKNATSFVHPQDDDARSKLTRVALKRLTDIEKDSFQRATSTQTSELTTDSLLSSLQGLQVRRPSVPSYSKDQRESSQIRVALRREIFHEAVQSGCSAADAKHKAEKILPIVEELITTRRDEKVKKVLDQAAKFDMEDAKLTMLDREILDKILLKRDNLFYSEEELLSTTFGAAKKTIIPDVQAPSCISDSRVRLNIFKTLGKKKSLLFWKSWDDDRAKVSNLSMGPKNAIEEQISWTNKGRMWPYPINNEYMLGAEENVSFMDHVFLEPYLAQYGLPKTGPVAHFMELVTVGLSKNPHMTVQKKREHLDAFAKYFSPEYIDKVQKLYELERVAASSR